MRIKFLTLILLLISTFSLAQISFDKGYLITNDGTKVDCFIKNNERLDNPQFFRYKLPDSDKIIQAEIDEIKEFGIINNFKFKRFDVKIDRSSDKIDELGNSRAPNLIRETLFLNVLVEGEAATLYSYVENEFIRYFFSINGNKAEQLIFKNYIADRNKLMENNYFRQQLYLNFKCPEFRTNYFKNVSYNKTDLVKFFERYNDCLSSEFYTFHKKNKIKLNISLKSGLEYSSLSIVRSAIPRYSSENSNLGFRVGMEAEGILPFNRNKIAFVFDPSFRSVDIKDNTDNSNLDLNYNTIVLPIGLRYYMFLNKKSKLFINAFYSLGFSIQSRIQFDFINKVPANNTNLELGLGYRYNDRFSIELRASTPKTLILLSQYLVNYKSVSFIVGYTLFKNKD